MPTNGFLPNSTGTGAIVLSDADYAVNAATAQGAGIGQLPPNYYNKVNRQATVIASMIGQFIVDKAAADANDSQSIATIETNFITALNKVISDAFAAGNTSPIATAKALYNVQKLSSTARMSASAAASGQNVTVLSGLNYTKKSPTSLLMIWGSFQTYSPGSFGAITMRLTVGTNYAEAGTTNGYTPSGGSGIVQLTNSPIFFITGVGTGQQAITLALRRDDSASWTTILNPIGTDASGYPTPNTLSLIIGEVEPT